MNFLLLKVNRLQNQIYKVVYGQQLLQMSWHNDCSEHTKE